MIVPHSLKIYFVSFNNILTIKIDKKNCKNCKKSLEINKQKILFKMKIWAAVKWT